MILIGCLFETYGGLRPISDAVRKVLYGKGVYENDLRDLLFYNRVRPKFFASEPASVTFCYTLFGFLWLVISSWRWKLPAYLGLVAAWPVRHARSDAAADAAAAAAVPAVPRQPPRPAAWTSARFLVGDAGGHRLSLRCGVVLAQTLFPHRLEAVTSGNDPSFFYRVQGPALAGPGHHEPLSHRRRRD